jgi:uncharacterized membrane protein YdfJ with MMPL/SSD domain
MWIWIIRSTYSSSDGHGNVGMAGVFLLTRIKEAHDRGLPNRDAVADGLQHTGRLVTAAAVLIDAFIIRALLVPARMVRTTH